MKYLYSRKCSGKLQKVAKIYEQEEYSIPRKDVDSRVIFILKTLQKAGYDAYIVGGAVRDFLIGKTPKDFDLVTNARPNQICKLFRRAKVIGKRFTIVLVPIVKNHYIEISTFRSANPNDSNEYGSISQDVLRRDFTCNSLYYCPIRNIIIDFLDGIKHIKQRKIISVYKNYSEDPIRMLRAIKFSVNTGFSLPFLDACMIFLSRKKIALVSSSRKTEEFLKIVMLPKSADVMIKCFSYKLLKYMIPNLYQWFLEDKKRLKIYQQNFIRIQAKLSKKSSQYKVKKLGIQALLQHFIVEKKIQAKNKKTINQYLQEVKEWLYPLTLPNIELKQSIRSILSSSVSDKALLEDTKEFIVRDR